MIFILYIYIILIHTYFKSLNGMSKYDLTDYYLTSGFPNLTDSKITCSGNSLR